MAGLLIDRKVTRFNILTNLLDRVWTVVVPAKVNVDLHSGMLIDRESAVLYLRCAEKVVGWGEVENIKVQFLNPKYSLDRKTTYKHFFRNSKQLTYHE